ncbi:MAG: sigma 54-interacting transcriptional regulator [Bacteroidia bacterium]|nr:sigma 54-interacting transcriptional regulator [Bacteroidia bacterium]MDW8333296.1 sigma 54-interacting transcriptional regulator [Bacteroidia bacterium]
MTPRARVLGELKARPLPIKDEMRANLLAAIKDGKNVFKGIIGYDDTVLRQLKAAILARHNILLLGLRGQAKTRIARQLTALLDEYTPILEGSELNDDPFDPISPYGKRLVAEAGRDAPIAWLHREERFVEKLATPDVTVADLIGDVDPIKAANLRLSYSDERVIHYGLVPRANRCLFILNELPDLQPRLQVALFNILQEKDVQIRGFKMRLPLDVRFVFTANPEDYTHRGSIVTPLKDRIGSQILTHYPKTIADGMAITSQEAAVLPQQRVSVPEIVRELIEEVAVQARQSEYVDSKSGVSARMTISMLEYIVAAAELRSPFTPTVARVMDVFSAVPSVTGKIELVYEGEQEGPQKVALHLMNKAVKAVFLRRYPDPEKIKRSKAPNPYEGIIQHFSKKNLDLTFDMDDDAYRRALSAVDGFTSLQAKTEAEKELILHGLAECSQIGKKWLEKGASFTDIVGGILGSVFSRDDDDEDFGPKRRV